MASVPRILAFLFKNFCIKTVDPEQKQPKNYHDEKLANLLANFVYSTFLTKRQGEWQYVTASISRVFSLNGPFSLF